MEFTSPRKVTLAGAGHVIPFNKGDTKFVPPALRAQAVEQGLEPVEAGAVDTGVPTADEAEAARIAAIKAAMVKIKERNDSKEFDAGGVPTKKAIAAATPGSEQVKDNDERLEIWGQVTRGE